MDIVTREKRSEIMRRIRGKDTVPEMKIRSMIHRMGYRFRLHVRNLPGKPDLVFPGKGKIIFVHGCFWHLHKGCKKAAYPKSRKAYWIPKLLENRERDRRITRELKRLGWKVLVIWQCEIAKEAVVSRKIVKFLEG